MKESDGGYIELFKCQFQPHMKEIKDIGTKACITIKRYKECAHHTDIPMTICQDDLG